MVPEGLLDLSSCSIPVLVLDELMDPGVNLQHFCQDIAFPPTPIHSPFAGPHSPPFTVFSSLTWLRVLHRTHAWYNLAVGMCLFQPSLYGRDLNWQAPFFLLRAMLHLPVLSQWLQTSATFHRASVVPQTWSVSSQCRCVCCCQLQTVEILSEISYAFCSLVPFTVHDISWHS